MHSGICSVKIGGSGLGTATGLITSGAIDRALTTQKAKKELKAAEKEHNTETENQESDTNQEKEEKEEKDCHGGNYKAGSCWCKGVIMTKNSTCEDGKIKYGNKNSGADSETYKYFKPSDDKSSDCAIEEHRALAYTKVTQRIMPDQCHNILTTGRCSNSVESYKTDGNGNCLELEDVDLKSGSGIVSKEECERCMILWKQRDECAKEAEDWCKKQNML